MTLKERCDAFAELGRSLGNYAFSVSNTELAALTENIQYHNPWFTPENVRKAVQSIGSMLSEKKLKAWLENYSFPDQETLKTVGIIMAGNIPAVGFHDALSVLISGNCLKVKTSSQDNLLIPQLLKMLCEIEPRFKDRIEIADQLKNIDAVIATGSNNSSRYFEFYFGKYPHVIRANRNSVAVLNGAETKLELIGLSKDIFSYFGLGCRNVSKIYVPYEYNFNLFFEAAEEWAWLNNHNKYFNNYEYSKAIFLINSIPHLDNGFLLVKEDKSLHSPIGVLHYETYNDIIELKNRLSEEAGQLQCIVSAEATGDNLYFGDTQTPGPGDYADGIDTIDFLLRL